MNPRLEILKHSIAGLRFGGSLSDWLRNFLSPRCKELASRVIEESQEEGDYLKFRLKGCTGELYYNQKLPLHGLYQTLAEQFYSWKWHYYQIPQTKVSKEDIVFDCGCAEGVFTYINKDTAKHIYAFEPLPEYFTGLRLSFKNLPNVTLNDSALGAERAQAYLKKAGIASFITSENTGTAVSVVSIDDYCAENKIKISYLKADLEGYEMELLKGAKNVIKKYKPKIAITTYHDHTHAAEIERFLKDLMPEYKFLVKGIEERKGAPVMLHAW